MATPMFRFDPVELPPEAQTLRMEVREFIKEHEHLMGFFKGEFNRDFSRAMGKKGWIGMTWPKQYGGHERSAFERYVIIEEMLVAGAPLSAHYTGDRLEFAADVAKACHHGSDDCSLEFLAAIGAGATVISSGDNETHAHPRPAIVAASAVTGHRQVKNDKLVTPLIYSTEIARSVRIAKIDSVTAAAVEVLKRDSIAQVDYSEVSSGALRPKKGKRSWKNMMAVVGIVYGLVNVRTDGRKILCATMNEGNASWDLRTFESRF